MLLNVNGASAGERLWADAGPAITRSLSPAATGLMGALNPLVAGVALKLAASKTAEIDSKAIDEGDMQRPGVGRIILLFFHRVVPFESVFMSLLPLTIPAPAFRGDFGQSENLQGGCQFAWRCCKSWYLGAKLHVEAAIMSRENLLHKLYLRLRTPYLRRNCKDAIICFSLQRKKIRSVSKKMASPRYIVKGVKRVKRRGRHAPLRR